MALPGNLPLAIWDEIVSLSVPEDRYEFLGYRDAAEAVWPQNPVENLIQAFWLFPSIIEKINLFLYSGSRFEFISSNVGRGRRKKCVHACEVAVQFLSHIKNIRSRNVTDNTHSLSVIEHLRNIYCDLNWEKRDETVNTFFQMLGILATNAYPSRQIQNIPLTFELDHEAKRSRKGVRVYQPRGLALLGFITLDFKIFVVHVGSQRDGTLENQNQWIQQRHVMSSPFDHFSRLPTEITTEIYRHHLMIPEYHEIATGHIRNPSLHLLQICKSLNNDLLPIMYDTCWFEFDLSAVALYFNDSPHHLNQNDRALWADQFLNKIGQTNARNMGKAKILVRLHRHNSYQYTPSIRTIAETLDQRCHFQILSGYQTFANNPVPVRSIPWKRETRRLCFQIAIPCQGRKSCIVEMQANWNTEQPGTLAHETQLETVRQVFRASMEGIRCKMDENGDIMPI